MFKKTINMLKYYCLKWMDLIEIVFLEFMDPNIVPHAYRTRKFESDKKRKKKKKK